MGSVARRDPRDEDFMMLVMTLQAKLGRLPTEDEIMEFLYGNDNVRKEIYNGTYQSPTHSS